MADRVEKDSDKKSETTFVNYDGWLLPEIKPAEKKKLDEVAHTTLGRVIDFGWTGLAGEAKTIEDKANRARKSDQYAEIAADTIAAIPRVGTITGGLTRGVLLSDLSGDKSAPGTAFKFVSDFGQGAALNRVGKYSAGAFSKAAALDGTIPLATELRTHLVTGMAFGGVKTAFNPATYKDAQGNFSSLAAAQNFGLGIGVGGALSVPSGFIGLRAGRMAANFTGGSAAESSALRSVVRNTVSGATGGGASGMVFGGVEAAREKLDAAHIARGALEGTLIGITTGAVMGGAERFKGPIRPAQAGDELTSRHLEMAATSENVAPTSIRDKTVKTDQPPTWRNRVVVDDTNLDLLTYLPRERAIISETKGKVTRVGSEKQFDFVEKPDFPDYDALRKNVIPNRSREEQIHEFFKLLQPAERPYAVFQVKGKETRILIPEEYAAQLNEVRGLRQAAEEPLAYAKLPASAKDQVDSFLAQGDRKSALELMPGADVKAVESMLKARADLAAHPLKDRVLPEDMIEFLEKMPHSNLVKEVYLQDKPDPVDKLRAAQYENPDFRSAATVGRDGKMTINPGDSFYGFWETNGHELSHLYKWNFPLHSKLFDKAHALDLSELNVNHKASRLSRTADPDAPFVEEEGIFHLSEHASRNLDEAWAVPMGNGIMSPDVSQMAIFAQGAPVRSRVLASAMEHIVNSSGLSLKPDTFAGNLLQRARYMAASSSEAANRVLVERALTGTTQQKFDSLELLSHFGTQAGFDKIKQLALAPSSAAEVMPRGEAAASVPARQKTLQQAAFEAMVGMSGRNKDGQLVFALEQGLAHPELRATAHDFVQRQRDARAPFYARILRFDGTAAEVPEMTRILGTIGRGDKTGAEMAFGQMMKALESNKVMQIETSEKLMRQSPELRGKVLSHLDSMVRAGLNPSQQDALMQSLGRLSTALGQQDRQSIDALADKARNYALLGRSERNMSPSAKESFERQEALANLAKAKDQAAIQPLLELAVTGSPQQSQFAYEALTNYSPNMVKHFGRLMKNRYADDRVASRRLSEIVEGRFRPGITFNDGIASGE
ncbi:MAG: hypothetical protein K2Y32_14775 [Candidatus Obscuribacterales bacterium]|nr:hypothetical protein [Candidatus Obscuribacterales bacterium]